MVEWERTRHHDPVEMNPKTRYAKNEGVNIAYQVFGDGPVDLLLIPGFVSHVEVVWEYPPGARFLKRLATFSRVIMSDRRGQGLSDRDAGTATIERTMDDARAVLDAVGSERTALFGISEGAPASLLFAATFPERTEMLVLFGASARVVQAPDYPIGLPEKVLKRNFDAIQGAWGDPVGLEFFAPDFVDDEPFREWWAKLLRTGSSPSGARGLLQTLQEIDVRHVLPAIRVPTLVMHRTDDLAIPIAQGRFLADHIEGAMFVELPGRNHVPWAETKLLAEEIEQFVTGRRPVPEHDRVLATVLFTDIVGSTERASSLGDRTWRDLLEAHNTAIRTELARYRGREVVHTGDGFLATFDGPARAIACSRSIGEAVRGLGIDVRAGLHTGEIELVDDNVGGIAVHIAARISSLAGAGEVLVSSTVKDLVVGSGIGFTDHGNHELKGVPGEWRLFAVAP